MENDKINIVPITTEDDLKMSVSYFNTNEYELMNKDNIVATVSCTRDEFNDLYFEIHHIFSQLPIGFKTI